MEWLTLAQNFGITAICLFSLAFAVWRALLWFAKIVIQPVASRHMKFLDDLTTAIAGQSGAMQAIIEQQNQNLLGVTSVLRQVEELINKHDELIKAVTEIQTRVGHMEVHAASVTLHRDKH